MRRGHVLSWRIDEVSREIGGRYRIDELGGIGAIGQDQLGRPALGGFVAVERIAAQTPAQ